MEADRGGRFSQFRSFRGGMILPGEDVLKATNDAKEKARSGKPVDEEPKPEEKEPEVPQPITDSTDEFGATPPAPASPATPK
jgi:hypothetical protein